MLAQDLHNGIKEFRQLCHNNDFGLVCYFDEDENDITVRVKRGDFNIQFTLSIRNRLHFLSRLKSEVESATRLVNQHLRAKTGFMFVTPNTYNEWAMEAPEETPPALHNDSNDM